MPNLQYNMTVAVMHGIEGEKASPDKTPALTTALSGHQRT